MTLSGQETGDYVLSLIAKRLKNVLGAGDIIGRIAGDEFAFTLMQATTEEDAEQLTQKIKESLESPITLNGEIHTISTSCGIALFPKHASLASEAHDEGGKSASLCKGAWRKQL